MAYGLFLYADLDTGERIEILKRDFVGSARKIAALSSWSWRPLDNDSAEVTDTPIVKGTLSLSIKDMRDFDYTAFFTVDATLWRVVLKYGGVQRWSGYVQPESYSSNSEYRSDINIMALDNLGQLEQIEYDYFDYSFVSLKQLVSKACGLIGWNFAPVVFDTRVLSGDGVLIEDSVLNVETFRKKTWWEVLSDVLFSFGLQLSYFDDNRYRISSVANKFDPARIIDLPDYTRDGGYSSDIVPPWKELNFKQDYQKIDNAFVYNPTSKSYKYVKDSIGNSTGTRNRLFSSDQWLSSQSVYTDGILFSNPFDYPPTNNVANFLYNKTLIYNYNGLDTDYIYKAFKTSQTDIAFEFTLKLWNFFMQYTRVGSPVRPQLSIVRGTNSGLDAYVVVVRCNVILHTDKGDYYLRENEWILNDSSKYIEFRTDGYKLNTDGSWTQSEKEFKVLIQSIPYPGELRLAVYKSKWEGGIYYQADQEFTVFTEFGFKPYAKSVDFTALETKVSITEKARTKKDITANYGELPIGTNSIVFAGGAFKDDEFATPLHDFHRLDNIGGVLPLSEIVWRGYAHHFNGFKTASGEPAGGKVLRGKFPPKGIRFDSVFRFETSKQVEYYVINSATVSGYDAELTLMQVNPYTHSGDYGIENAVETGVGSFTSGGGETYIQHVSGGSGGGGSVNGKRLYELSEATEEELEAMEVLVDKNGRFEAGKAKANMLPVKPHAKSHFIGGKDEIKPYDIGAAKRGGDKDQDFATKNLTASGNVGSAEYISGFLGGGWNIDAKGNAEIRSLKIWEALIVPELIKNQVSISRNETWFTDGGVIENVRDHTGNFKWATSGGTWAINGKPIASNIAAAGSYVITLKEKPSFRSGDLLKAIVENENGFLTAKMRVTYVGGDYCVVTLIGSVLPSKDMVIARVGNDIDKDRQWSIYVDALSGYIRVLADMSSFDVKLSNIKFQAGNLSGLRGLGYNEDIPPIGVYAPGLYIGTDQVTGLGAMILALENSISLKASAKDVEASLKVQADQIALKVDKNGVISSINQSAEQIEINANKIKLEGYTSINNHFEVLLNGDVRMVNAYVSGEVIAERGRITGTLFMGSESGDVKQVSNLSDQLILYRGDSTFSGIGKNVLPGVLGFEAPSRFENTKSDPFGSTPNIAVYASASGSAFANTTGAGNHAIYAPKGDYYGFRGYTKQISSSQTLSNGPKNYYCYNTAQITLTLPSNASAEFGQEYWIKRINDSGVTINGNIYTREVRSSVDIAEKGQTYVFINDGQFWQLAIMNT